MIAAAIILLNNRIKACGVHTIASILYHSEYIEYRQYSEPDRFVQMYISSCVS